ncbi:MAG: efflux RND transporter periplasmic adaptor subunit, partial [Planktotalea sp.]|uniref:efflux RND transporter periplasmic adaptor subunit n=1 Tax=Planktotalea sp. TaxID=2029877 RepID=UPI003C721421
LLSFYSKEMVSAAALYLTDVKTGGKKGALGSLQRLQNLGASKEVIEEIERTGKVPVSMTMMAPRHGVVLERMAVEGMMAQAGETLFKIADTSVVWVMADVPEFELSSIRDGAVVNIRIRGLKGPNIVGKVDLIYPEIQGETRTAKVRVQVDNSTGVLIANMYADVSINTGGTDTVVTVPESAVIDSGDRQVVILDKGEGSFEPRDVKLGSRGNGMIEIMEGVSEGDRLVVSGNFLIDAESNLKAALSALTPAETSK